VGAGKEKRHKMNRYRNISTSFWTDSKVDDDFTPEDKYFYLYLLTNPHTNICGCYEISAKQMERETGYNTDTCNRLIDRMVNIHHVIKYSKTTKEVLLLHWGRYNWTKSDKVVKAVTAVADYIKNKEFKKFVLSLILQNTETETDTETETETDTETDVCIGYEYPIDTVSEKPKRDRFVPPTLDDVRAYYKETGKPIDAEAFIDYYSANGWRTGKNPMKDWKAAVRQWRRRDEENGKVYKEPRHDLDDIFPS
jgi:hypothetical protein